ncbi:DNA (cytosine-5-)-methyltransferase [Armatimonas sp.]|uniref:DNA (cytosine-5-)-methyltransferase n=1 Tax=Armatimonas sp. TaxID=1872638 RepID=UPI0037523074
MSVTVQEAAKTLGVSIDTIRRWEKKGLVRAGRSKNNYRIFDLQELRDLQEKYSGNSGSGRGFQVLKSPSTEISVIELFSGAGGMALGFSNAGLKTKMLVEINKHAVATLKFNQPEWNVVSGDVREVCFKEHQDQIDVVAGGFPCQAFSYAGMGRGFEDTRGTLFFEFARCVKEVRPKIAIGENVRGLVKHDDGRTLKTMINALEELGYDTTYQILRAQFLDVAQKRERLIIMGIRKDLDIQHLFPKERDYTISLREALEECPESVGGKYTSRKAQIMEQVPPGGYWRDLPLDLQKEYMAGSFHLSGGKTGMARRLSWDEPSLTLTCNPAQKQTERCHPQETRPLSCREYARIQTFPDDWQFQGGASAQYKQIGNAVPCNLAYHLGRCIIAMINGEIPEGEEFTKISKDIKPKLSEQTVLSL